MKEQLISFETAKLAKEKGFDVPCWNAYYKKDELAVRRGISYNKYIDQHVSEPYSISDKGRVYYFLLTPTQSLLQKWLRDKHDILVESTHYTAKYFTFKIYERNSIINIIKLGSVDNLYDTYEEALELGLVEALKLI